MDRNNPADEKAIYQLSCVNPLEEIIAIATTISLQRDKPAAEFPGHGKNRAVVSRLNRCSKTLQRRYSTISAFTPTCTFSASITHRNPSQEVPF